MNWAGKPLETFDFMLACIRGTDTDSGLQVEAFFVEKAYKKGIKVAKEIMETLCIEWHEVCPRWNYTLSNRARIQLCLFKVRSYSFTSPKDRENKNILSRKPCGI